MKFVRTLGLSARMVALGCSLYVFANLAGCVSTPRGAAAREWSLTLREMQIVPVFPPREDVYVGDVYVVDQDELKLFEEDFGASHEGFLPISILAAHIPLQQDTSIFYNARPSFPRTDLSNDDPSNAAQPTEEATDVYTRGDVSRLRIVGFPEFMSATITQGDIAAFIPTEAVNIGAAAGFTQSQQVKISVPVAESYAYPAAQAFKAAEAHLAESGINKVMGVDPALVGDGGVMGHLRLITEVYYTRVIDVSFFNSQSRGARVDAKINAPPGLTAPEVPPPAEPPPASPFDDPAPASADVAPPDAASTAADLVSSLNTQLDAAMASQVPGGKIRFLSAGAYGVAMRRTFERPVAIGYRGLLIEVQRKGKDGIALVSKGTISSFIPTFDPDSKKPAGGDDEEVPTPAR
ncbi:MAG: hypothetical protein H7210_08430 [Pyrinomonadaceae bacterium]|nr:hypothetical protein [Phycisphaerales bacterium]